MSVKKIDALEKKASENQKKAEQLKAEVEQLKAVAASYAEEAEKAAEVGDVESYKSLKQKAEDEKAVIYVKQASIRKCASPSKEELQSAWADFQKEHDAAFAKNMSEYEDARKMLCERFMWIMKEQGEARIQRKRLAALAGLPDNEAVKAFPFSSVTAIEVGQDRGFFYNKHDITLEESNWIMSLFSCRGYL